MRAAREARAVDHVCLVLDDGLHQDGVLGRIVLEVGVLHDDDLASGLPEAFAQSRALAHVLRLEDDDVAGLAPKGVEKVA
ncbi:hypothetical protein D3C87_1733660 [compost metagenome]